MSTAKRSKPKLDLKPEPDLQIYEFGESGELEDDLSKLAIIYCPSPVTSEDWVVVLAGKPYLLARWTVVIGRDRACPIRVDEPGVAPRHATLRACEPYVRLRDLGSGLGTRVDGVEVGEAMLEGGEQIEVGPLRFHVSRAAPFLSRR